MPVRIDILTTTISLIQDPMNLVFDRLRRLLGSLASAAVLLSAMPATAQTVSDIKPFSTLMFFQGVSPTGNVALGHDGALYGPTSPGGGAFVGLFYRLAADMSSLRTIYQYGLTYDADFNRIFLGANPTGQMLLASDGFFYGVTQTSDRFGGTGTIYRMAQDGTGYTKLYEFEPLVREGTYNYLVNDSGAFPQGGLVEGFENGVPYLYGVTFQGGRPAGTGVIFKIRRDGSAFEVIHEFAELDRAADPADAAENEDGRPINADGINPNQRLLFVDLPAPDGPRLYGTTSIGGINGTGVVFRIDTDGTDFVAAHFDPTPATITDSADANYGKTKTNHTGAYPQSSLVRAADGYIYGTTSSHGGIASPVTVADLVGYSDTLGYGTVFRVSTNFVAVTQPTDPAATLLPHSVIHRLNFTGSENNGVAPGSGASGNLTLINNDTEIVGTTQSGGILGDAADPTADDTAGIGLVYRFNTTTSQLTQIFVFGADANHSGAFPSQGVVAVPEGTDYAYYGVTSNGGAWGQGTVFKLGTPVNGKIPGTPEPYDDGGGSFGKWFIAALILLAAVQLIMLRHRRSRLKRVLARQT
jgi:uncharacterized repeat protein (TIGR03803 family)